MKILFIGDIVGKGGRRTVTRLLPDIKKKENIDIVIANAENIAHGTGVTRKTLNEMLQAGVDVFTSGNHIFSKPEANELVEDKEMKLLRPANYEKRPGKGMMHIPVGKETLTIINLEGRAFMNEVDVANPFTMIDDLLADPEVQHTNAIFVDFHAEATSEKVAFGWLVDGRVSCVVGTHTHIATADQEVLPEGTAYVTDVGMTGPHHSVIGVDKNVIVSSFVEEEKKRHIIPETGKMRFNSIIVDIDGTTKKAKSIKRFDQVIEV